MSATKAVSHTGMSGMRRSSDPHSRAEQAPAMITRAPRSGPASSSWPLLSRVPVTRASAKTRTAVVARQVRSGTGPAAVESIPEERSMTTVLLAEGRRDRDPRGSEDHDEDARQDEQDQRDHDADGHLLGLLLGPLAALRAHLLALDAEHPGDRDAEAVGLHHGTAEGLEVGQGGALGHE